MSEHNQSAPTDAPQSSAREDELLGVIADVEKQLSALKTFRAERDETRQRLEQRESEVAARQKELESLRQALEGERRSLEERQHKLQQSEQEFASRRDETTRELASRKEQLERDFHALQQEQTQSEQERAKVIAELEHQTRLLVEREQRVSETAQALSRQREEMETAARSLADREKAAQRAIADAQRASEELQKLRAACEEARSLARTREDDLAAAQKQAQDLIVQLASARGQLQDVQRDLDRSSEAQGSLMGELQAREERLQEHARSIAQHEEKLRAAGEELQKRSAAASQFQSQAEDFKRQLIERDTRIQDLSQKLAAATGKLREVSQQIKQQAEIIGQAEQLERELTERQTRIEALERQLTDMRARISAAEAGADRSAASAQQNSELQERIGTLEDALRTAHDELVSAIDENKHLRKHVGELISAQQSGEIPEDIGEAVARRWSRLRLMRNLLREQTTKLNAAGDALRARFEECEKILAQRETLAAGHAALLEARRKLERAQAKAARAKSWSTLFYALASVALLLGLSWLVAGEIAPATYAARASIAAEAREGSASEDQLREWQRYHEALLGDPVLMEVAAERMQRRGIESLGSAGALDGFLKQNASHTSAAPGQITLEVRGPGAAKATRVLDTFVAAYCSQSNAGRERRADGLGTTVIEAANPGAGPIEDDRLMYAVGIFVGGLSLSLVFVMVVWKRLSMAKQRFEEEQLIDATLAESSWREAADKIAARA